MARLYHVRGVGGIMVMMQHTGETRAKLLYLESLRGIAAFVVILSHYAEAFFPHAVRDVSAPIHLKIEPIVYSSPLSVFLSGNFAVCLFFVMSGFVLVRPFFQTKRHDLLLSATLRRYFRLMPPVAVSILLGYLVLKLGFFTNTSQVNTTGSNWLTYLWIFPPHLFDAIRQALYGAFINQDVTYNPLLWTMRTEFFGSLLIFGLAAISTGLRRRWLLYGILIILFLKTYYLGFIIGMILADYFSQSKDIPSVIAAIKPKYFAGALIIGMILGGYPSGGNVGLTMYKGFIVPGLDSTQLMSFWHTIGAFLVVFSVLCWSSAKEFLEHKLFVKLGLLSFSLYLTHMIILCSLGTYLFGALHSQFGYRISFLITFVVAVTETFFVSVLYTKYIDQPSIKFAKKVGKWLMSAPSSSATNAVMPPPQAKYAPAPSLTVTPD